MAQIQSIFLKMLSDHAGYFVQGDIIKHTYMALGVELGKNFAKVHCQIMINNVGEAVSKFLNTDFFVAYEPFFMRQTGPNTKNKRVNFGML